MHKILAAIVIATGFAAVSAAAEEVNNSFTDRAMMSPFYSDENMTTMRADEELQQILAEMNPEARQTLRDDCANPAQYRNQYHYGLCDKINNM